MPKSNERRKRKMNKPLISKRDLEELMGMHEQVLERRHGALRRKGR
ncbi:hypothetical protein [Sporolactobacillus pectinivorans]|nr:hypothetical protein [Sporolactobacillus pectinivorans]